MTCLKILKQAQDILDQFISHMNNLWTDRNQPFLSQLEQLFLEKHLIDHEFEVLKLLLDQNIISYVEILVQYWKNRENIIHISRGCINLFTQYNITNPDKLLILQNILDINEETSGERCISAYNDYCIHYSNTYSESILSLISQHSLSKKLLEFLYSLTSIDVDNLREVVNDWDETLINTETIFDFVLLKNFFDQSNSMIQGIHDQTKSLEFNDIIDCFKKIWEEKPEFKNILNVIKRCSESLISIQRIHRDSTNREASIRKRMSDIMKNSNFYFDISRSKSVFNDIEYEFDICIIVNNSKVTYFSDLSDLRDRARLIEYANNNNNKIQNYTENDIQQLRLFISFTETIEIILKNLTALNRAGYPSVLPKKEFLCNQGDYNELEEFQSNLEIQLTNWNKQLCDMYEKCIDLTYFSYQQIWIVEDSLYKQTIKETNDSGYHLLKFIGINPQLMQLELLSPISDDPYDRLKNMTTILNMKRIHRDFDVEENGQIKKKIFVIQTSYIRILRSILSLFYQHKISINANRLFYCTKNTNWIEIRAFIYRCFYSQTLHQLIQPELLSVLIQDQFVQLLNQLIKQYPKHLFYLGIISTESTSHLHIINGLKMHHIVQTIHDQDIFGETALDNIIQRLIGDKCLLVTSRISGLGKSTYIRNEILRLGKNYVKFSISGDTDIDTLMERLRDKKIQSVSSIIAIHIDIGPVTNIQHLNEFLYCLILFRCFRLGQMPVFISADIPIYIELDSSSYLINRKDELVIFQYLKMKYIEQMNWNELKINSSIIQLVVNYLQSIEDKTINKNDIKEETSKSLDLSTCIRLLKKYFLPKKNIEFVSWTQLNIFIGVYYKLFSGFSLSYFVPDERNPSTLRLDILNALLNTSDQFTSLSVETVRQNQRSINENKSILDEFSDAIIRWDKVQPFTIIFNDEGDPLFVYKTRDSVPPSLVNELRSYFQIIYRNRSSQNLPQRLFPSFFKKPLLTNDALQTKSPIKTSEEQLQEFLSDHNTMTHEQFFLKLTLLSRKYSGKKSICEKCFNQYKYTDQQCTYCPTQDILIRSSSLDSPESIEDFKKMIAKKLQSEYILTADNYIKMLLIYLRVQSNLPVLIMGETGCGKTALIQFLCQKILDDDMIVFHIHAGIKNEKIIETMRQFIERADKLSEQNTKKKLWIFFDEFNTTSNIGLLKEIVCDRTLLGESLPTNMVFLGACNPQRRKENKEESTDNIGIKRYHLEMQRQINGGDSSPLLYSVIPIPETMLEHIWNYGYLDEATEKSYIKTILNACEQLTTNQIWFNCIVNSISESQKFFRQHEDVSSVSLRDVVRFCRFYKWFYENNIMFALKQNNRTERASLLALFLCYYFRLNSSKKRENYIRIIENCLKKFKPEISSDFLNKLLENEKMDLVNRMELPLGTAKNRALTDNIFVLFTCILNRIPVILCGRPGSSKTSAAQIVISNLKGTKSKDVLFQTLPELIAISYQGSHNCTSESIIKVFSQADKCAQAKNDKQLFPVIIFDEIGLAELSPHNPLKVLHSELEIEKCRYGFVGLSNWRLDSSKMNRAIYLSCPDPNFDDLKITAQTLLKSMLSNDAQTVPLDDSFIEGLAMAYMKLCEHMEQHRSQYYFGLRDYYSLIKGIVYDMTKEQDLYEIIWRQLSINFDGVFDGSKFMWSKFCEHINLNDKITQYSPLMFDQLINKSISSRTGRFLMLIGDNENDFDYVQRYINLKHSLLQTRTLIGSTLIGDFIADTTYTEQYNTRVLMDIILYAEKDIVLFLRGLGHLYDNLYDLFNQNFAVSAKKKFSRIALGSLYHPRCFIHENFYCVVFIKRQDLDKYDPPFLNRFEKHLIDTDTLIQDHHKLVMSILVKWINTLLSMRPNGNFPCRKHLFIEFSDNYILNLVLDAFDKQEKKTEEVIKYCQDQMIRTSSFDFPLLLSLKCQTNNRTSDIDNYFIEKYYEIHGNLSFLSFINQIFEQKTISKLLIYTYTPIYHIIDYSNIIECVEEIKLHHFKTELELIQKIKMHYQIGPSRLLLIRIDYHHDYKHISMLKHILLNEQIIDENRGVCLIFHLQRNKLNETNNDVFFNGWSRVMIDDLQEHKIIPKNFLVNPSYKDLIGYLDVLNLKTIFDELVNQCTIQFRYHVTNKYFEDKINERRDRIIKELTSKNDNNYQSLHSIIKNYFLEMIKNMIYNSDDWRQDLLTNEIIIGSCRSLNDALIKTVSLFLSKYLSLLLVYLEKYSLMDSYLFLIKSNENIRNKLDMIWIDCWTTTIKRIDMSIMNQNNIEVPLIFDLHLPCATMEYEIICQIRQTIAQNDKNDDKNWIDFAYEQLINTSIYGQFINTILNDPDLFYHYYHDQLTLARNEANIHTLSTLFIQNLLTSKMSATPKDQLKHLLINYEELFEIMRIFEISISFIDNDQDYVFRVLDYQFIVFSDVDTINLENNSDLYRLIMKETNFYLIPPKSKIDEQSIFQCTSNPFIETSLMNILERLISSHVINQINDIEQLLTMYGLIIRSMTTLRQYEITNLEKVHSFLRLAGCILSLFTIDKSVEILKEVYTYCNFCTSFNTLIEIRNLINHLKNVIDQQQSILKDTIIHQPVLKFANELLRNWFIENSNQYNNILIFINNYDQDLWKYSAKIFTLIDNTLQLSSTMREDNEQILESNEINQCLNSLNDSTRKIEVIMTMHIFIQLILDENYEQIINILKDKFQRFQENLNKIKLIENNQKLELISCISWIRYYIQYYVYAVKNNITDEIMKNINKLLVRDDCAFYSTIKLFIIKQLCQIYNVTFDELSNKLDSQNYIWIRSMITPSNDQQNLTARKSIVLPTPLFECYNEFIRIDGILSSDITIEKLKDIIIECSTNQDTAYCFIMWFIHYYTRFYMFNILPDKQMVQMITQGVNKELVEHFDPIGYKLIYSLCTNFDENSYFQLKKSMSKEALHYRLLILNIIALLISFKHAKIRSFLSFILFDEDNKMPLNYTEHFQKFEYLTGVINVNNSALIQMINIQNQIKNDHQDQSKKINILRCSSDCSWLFYFVNCDTSDEQITCPLCKNEVNIIQKDSFIVINKPNISMNINEASQFISEYIEQHQFEKHDHLKHPLTHHFINFLTHAIFLFLNESKHLPNSMSINSVYFEERITTYYILLEKHLSNIDQCYIWLYKLINHMINKDFIIKGHLNSQEKVIEFEKFIEDKLIIPHINSVVGEIREYKSIYADFVYGDNKQKIFVNFVDELVEDNDKYPFLYLFNVTNAHSINIIDDFHSKLQLLPNYEKIYPLTTFLLNHLSDYDNIQYIYPIIKLTNYIMQRLNHRIKRNDATKKTISDWLKTDSNIKIIYEQFLDVWYKINLKEVYFDDTKYKFEHLQLKNNFSNQTNLSMFLLNKSNNNENMILLACLQTIANLQNNIIKYFSNHVLKNKNENYSNRTVPLQSIQQKQLFGFHTNKLRKFLIEKGLMINYKYGMSKEIIYDYEEIEWILRDEINCLPLIDINNIQYFNYQYELYNENISLINDIRQRFQQKLFDDQKRNEIKIFINNLDNDSILELSNLVEYILRYLRNINNKNIIENSTIQIFINEYIHLKLFTDDKIFKKKPLSSIHLQYIIDLYELIEEFIFDKIFLNNIRNELCEKSFSHDQQILIVKQFIDMILYDNNIDNCFKNFIIWINMLKRLLVRLLSSKMNINFDSSLYDYIKRIDMWKGNITKDNIRTIEITRDIHLKHAFIIFKGLKEKQDELESIEQHKCLTNNQHEENNNRITTATPRSITQSNPSLRRNEPRRRNDLRNN